MEEFFEANRRNWDERAAIHRRDTAGGYQVEAFLRGEDIMQDIESREIGDVTGKRIAHLQCHFGLDTLGLERRGASCVGLDFSPVAIREARALAAQTKLNATFVQGNVYDARQLITGEFDLVYVTWGAINWLPDIAAWAGVVASLLKQGGALYLLEGHPSLMTLDETTERLIPRYDWRTPQNTPFVSDNVQTYTGDQDTLINTRNYEWIHPLSDIINGLIAAGLRLEWLNEHEELPWQFAPIMIEKKGKRVSYILPGGFPRLPLSYSIRAVKV